MDYILRYLACMVMSVIYGLHSYFERFACWSALYGAMYSVYIFLCGDCVKFVLQIGVCDVIDSVRAIVISCTWRSVCVKRLLTVCGIQDPCSIPISPCSTLCSVPLLPDVCNEHLTPAACTI